MPHSFRRPSAAPDFLRAQETLEPNQAALLAKLQGSDPPASTPQVKAPRAKEDRSHRTTVWLSPVVQRKIRIRALERGQTVSAYLLELLARDGICDEPSSAS